MKAPVHVRLSDTQHVEHGRGEGMHTARHMTCTRVLVNFCVPKSAFVVIQHFFNVQCTFQTSLLSLSISLPLL